ALLFLGAGSVIVMLHHEQNIWNMGGLSRKLPITFASFLVGALALIGCPPFSGFFSKDAILALAYERNTAIFAVALFTAFLTAFFDQWIIDAGAVGGSSRGAWGIGALLRLVQVGNLQAYVFLFGLGVVAIIYFAIFRF